MAKRLGQPVINLEVTGRTAETYYTTGDIPTKKDNYSLTFSFLEQYKTYLVNTILKFKLNEDTNQLRQQE